MEKYTTDIEIEKEETEESPEVTLHPEKERVRVKEKKTKRGLGFYFLNVLLGLLILGIGGFGFVYFFCDLRNVEYSGVNISETAQIEASLLSYEHCDNAVYAFLINTFKKHESIPFVKEARVTLKDKNTLLIKVKEDETKGVFETKAGLCYFDSEGVISEISKKYILDTPIITGLTLKDPVEYEPLNITGTQKTIILNSLKYLGEAKIQIDEIQFEKDGTFGYKWKNVFIDMGVSSEVREKCARLPAILPKLEGEQGILHLEEWGRENSDIIFEKLPG